MAITYTQNPSFYTPSDNPILYGFTSDQTGQVNFSFKVETYINAILVSTDTVYPESGTRSHFDASNIAKYVVPSPITTNVLSTDANQINTVQVKVFEVYGTPAIDQGSLLSFTTLTFKSRLSNEDFTVTDFDGDYVGKLFLTNRPRTENIQVLRLQDVYTSMIVNSSETLEINFYDSSNVLIETYNDTQNYKIWQLNLRSDLLDAVMIGSIDDVAYYTVQIGTSEIVTYEFFDNYCFNPHSLVWMNEYGSFDTFVYSHNNELLGSTKTKSYKKQFGNWEGTLFNYDLKNSGQIDFFKEVIDQGVLSSDYIEDTIQNWLNEQYKSTFMLLYNLAGFAIAINITDSSFKEEQGRFEELIFSIVKYQKSNSNKSMVT
jgi:hypothetical protein